MVVSFPNHGDDGWYRRTGFICVVKEREGEGRGGEGRGGEESTSLANTMLNILEISPTECTMAA